MKICQIGTGAEPISEKSSIAVELVIYNLSKSLAELKNEVHITDIYEEKRDKKLKYHLVKVLYSKTNHKGFKHLVNKIIFSINSLFLLLKLQKKEKFDIIHIQNQFPGLPIILFKKMLKTKIIYTSHIPFWALPKEKFGNKLYLKTFLERICLKKVDKIISVSNSQKQGILEKVKINPEKIKVIQNGVDLEKFYPKKSKMIEGGKDKEIVVISVARISKVKNQFLIIKAVPGIIKKEKNIKFIFIGQLEDKFYVEKIKNFIRKNKLEKYVEILGTINYNLLPKYYRNADIFISSSNIEGFPLTVLEAMASGCAIILSKIKPHEEIAKNSEIIYFEQNNLRDLIEKLTSLIKNKEKIKKLSRKSIITAKKFYSWKNVALKNIEVYKETKNKSKETCL